MTPPRKFDHEEAAARHAAGESYVVLAAEYGVRLNAVYQAVRRFDPEWRRQNNEYSREHQRRTKRTTCTRCGAVIWKDSGKVKTKTGLCLRCVMDDRITTVREDTLHCSICAEWKPDRAFPRSRHHVSRRHRHSVCRGCQAADRQRRRLARQVPCVDCGTLTSPPGTNGRRTSADAPPRCQSCANRLAHSRRRVAA